MDVSVILVESLLISSLFMAFIGVILLILLFVGEPRRDEQLEEDPEFRKFNMNFAELARMKELGQIDQNEFDDRLSKMLEEITEYNLSRMRR